MLADSQGSPNVGQAEAERLITQQKVVALVGCYQSAVTKTASQVAERYQIPFFNVATCGAYLHLRGLKWFFRCFGNDIIYSDNMFTFFSELRDELRTQGKDLRTVMVVHENTGAQVRLKLLRRLQRNMGLLLSRSYPTQQHRLTLPQK